MKMGLKNMANCESMGFGLGEVFRDIALWINDHSVASRGIANEVTGMRETFQIELLEVQSCGSES
jgi:hypothetical protein